MSDTSTGNKIQVEHLARTALVYRRQSSPGQVRHNVESRRLQYALAQRASALGFERVQTIDCDPGRSATVGSQRPGFQQLLSAVAMGDVGIVFSGHLATGILDTHLFALMFAPGSSRQVRRSNLTINEFAPARQYGVALCAHVG
jgi:hypothetical protein